MREGKSSFNLIKTKSNIKLKKNTQNIFLKRHELFLVFITFNFLIHKNFNSFTKYQIFKKLNSFVDELKLFKQELFYKKFLIFFQLSSLTLKLTQQIYIILLDLITSYKGFRHLKGFPLRGQRTWSNSWSTYKNNQILRNIRFDWALKYYNLTSRKDIKIGLFAEFHNLLWKKQWHKNWWEARIKRLARQTKLVDDIFKIDLKAIALNQIFIPSKKKELTKKQKALKEKSMFLSGFSIGFSKETHQEIQRVKNIKQLAKKERFKTLIKNSKK